MGPENQVTPLFHAQVRRRAVVDFQTGSKLFRVSVTRHTFSKHIGRGHDTIAETARPSARLQGNSQALVGMFLPAAVVVAAGPGGAAGRSGSPFGFVLQTLDQA